MSLYKSIFRPIAFRFSAETAHEIGINALSLGLRSAALRRIAAGKFRNDELGPISRFGLSFSNPVGVAAGFDKNGIAVSQLSALGFGFVEVGTITYYPQPGNPKPRLFRLPEDRALINRLGFNNHGAREVVDRLKRTEPGCILGVNIGRNKEVPNEDAIENYLKSFELAHPAADYIAVNVSSPNTPNLRELQRSENLEELLHALQTRNRELSGKDAADQELKPLLVKIAPDLDEEGIEAIADISLRLGISGIIATNTTVSREGLKSSVNETGGLSGAPLRELSNDVIAKLYGYSKGKIPLIGVGGIFTAEDAFEKISRGASLLQAYTGFVYEGPRFASNINAGLARILGEKGFGSLDEAVGSGV